MKLNLKLAVILALSLPLIPPAGYALDAPGESSAETGAQSEPAAANSLTSQMDIVILNAQTNYQHGRYKESVQLFEQAQKIGATSNYQKALISLGLAEAYRSSGRF